LPPPALFDILQPMTSAEQKIVDLSTKVIALQDSREFESAIAELRDAIHTHLSGTRDKVADLAFLVANGSESKAAD
jgi:hypothetical protein